MRPPLLLLLALATPFSASADSPLARAPTSGLEAPTASAATRDDALALTANPALLGFQPGLSLSYLHTQRLVGLSGDGVYAGGAAYGALGFGVSLEWLRPDGGAPSLRRTSFGLSLGSPKVSLGAAYRSYASDFSALDTLETVDAGLALRPLHFLSAGLVVRDLGAPTLGGTKLPRRVGAAIGVRPFGERLTLAVDAEVAEKTSLGLGGFDRTALGYTARVVPLTGVAVIGGFFHRVDGGPTLAQLGLALDLEGFGVESTAALPSAGDTGMTFGARLGRGTFAPLSLSPRAEVAVIDLEQELTASSGVSLLAPTPHDLLLDAVTGLARLGEDASLAGVLLRTGTLDEIGLGQAYELRQAILALRKRGKKVAVLLTSAGDAEFLLASAADRIFTTPEAPLLINGLVTRVNFYRNTLAKIGVEAEAVRVGPYKNAPDAYVRDEISDAHKEVVESLLDDLFGSYRGAAAPARKLTPDQFDAALAAGILSPARAQEVGLIDERVFPDAIEEALAKLVGEPVRTRRETLRPPAWTSWGAPPKLAVIPITGLITMGRSASDPFGIVHTSGAETLVAAINEAAADDAVKAIVVRVDSGGGDAQASDLIWRALVKAREKKPVVAAMSDVAASGGYYAAAGCQKIFALPTTITGSIGVFAMKVSLEGLFGLLDVGSYSSTRGAHAAIFGLATPWTPSERDAMQAYVDAAYGRFVEVVAAARKLDKAKVDELARGRVWTGSQARDRGLVDELTGLAGALAEARSLAGLSPGTVVDYPIYRPTTGLLSGAGASPLEARIPLPPALQTALRELPAPLLMQGGGVFALLEYGITVD